VMSSKRLFIWATVVVFVCGSGAGSALAQRPEKALASTPSTAEKPDNAYEEILKRMLGTWDVQARLWFEPRADPVAMSGTSITEKDPVDGFIQTRLKATLLGEMITGMGLDGYDQTREKFVSVWIDSADAGIATFEGTYDPNTRAITSFGEKRDPETGKKVETKGVTTFKSNSMYTYEAWVKDDKGEWVKMMEMMAGRVN
jgi:hypothetical protein